MLQLYLHLIKDKNLDNRQKNFIAGLIGNILDRYDMALIGMLAASMAPSFFPSDDKLLATIKVYAVTAIGLFTRPVGAFLFAKLAMNIGSRKVMIICLVGVAMSTGLLGLIPSHNIIGNLAPAIFILVRFFQGIFASGENAVAPFFIIQNAPVSKATRTSAYYNCSALIGVLLASLATTLVHYSGEPSFYWRYAFIFGFFTSIAGVILRVYVIENLEDQMPQFSFKQVVNLASRNKKNIIRVVFIESFSYITYTIPFIFMMTFISEITNIERGEVLQINNVLYVLDVALTPVFGILAERFDRRKFMASISIFVAVTILPLFYFMSNADFIYIMLVRLVIIFAGLAFIAPKYAFYYNLFKGNERYLLFGVGFSLAEETLGRNSTTICLSLWYYFRSPIAPACYILIVAILATLALTVMSEEKEKK